MLSKVALLCLVWGLCFACERAAPEPSPTLELVVPAEFATLDPRFCIQSQDMKVSRLVHSGLVSLAPDTLEPRPLVARSWHYRDPSHLELSLRPGLRFHSGQALTADDVCATLLALKEPSLGSPHRAVVRAIGSCQVQSDLQLTIGLAEPRATLLTDLEVPILRADQVARPARGIGELDGLGPYRILRATPTEVLLERVVRGQAAPGHARVAVRTVRDENARALRLLAGRADILPNALSPSLLPAIQAQPGVEVKARTGANVTYLLINNELSPLDQKQFRWALAAAIDRESIVRYLYAGRARVARDLIPPGHWAHNPDLAPIRFAPDVARDALAGHRELSLLTSTDRARVTVARAITQMFTDVDLAVRVVPLDLGVLFERLDRGDFDLAILQIPEFTEPNLLRWFFHPDAIHGAGGEGRNRARYRSVELGALLDEASRDPEVAHRRRLYRRASELLRSDMPVVPLWHEDQVAVVSQRAAGFALSAEGRWAALSRL